MLLKVIPRTTDDGWLVLTMSLGTGFYGQKDDDDDVRHLAPQNLGC